MTTVRQLLHTQFDAIVDMFQLDISDIKYDDVTKFLIKHIGRMKDEICLPTFESLLLPENESIFRTNCFLLSPYARNKERFDIAEDPHAYLVSNYSAMQLSFLLSRLDFFHYLLCES